MKTPTSREDAQNELRRIAQEVRDVLKRANRLQVELDQLLSIDDETVMTDAMMNRASALEDSFVF